MVFKVGKETKVGKLAAAIKGEMSKSGEVTVTSIGKEAGWKSLKAIVLSGKGCTPGFKEQEIGDKKISVLTMEII